jgi:PAS domain S-box-containing protein
MAHSNRIRILYIEDDPGLARLMQKRLGKAGYTVDIATDGAEGIAKYEADSYDILFLDQSLPTYDGLEVLRILGSRGSCPPTIMITGTGDERVAVEAMKLGAGDYIIKDVGTKYLELLPSVIEKVLQQRRAMKEKQRAEEALRRSEEKYRTVLEEMEEGYFETDLAGNLTFINDAGCRNLGYPREELIGKNNRQYTDAANAKKIFEAFNELYRTGKPCRVFDYETIKKDGTKAIKELSVSLMRDPEGKQSGFRGISRDITERRQAENSLREKEERFRQFFENEPEYCYMISPGGIILDANNAALNSLGYKKEELVGEPLGKIYSPDSLPKVKDLIAQWKETGSIKNQEIGIVTKDGARRTVLLSAGAVRDADGKILYSVSVQRDITEHQWIKEALQKSEEGLRVILEGASDGFLDMDKEGTILVTNERMKETLADPHPEGKPLSAFYDEENQEILAHHLKARWEGKGTVYEIVLTDKAGRRHNLLVSGTPYRDKQGVIQGAFGIYHDVTHEREAARVLSEHKEALRNSFFGTAEALSKVIEDRDPYTSGHSTGVAGLAEAIARTMGFPEDRITGIYIAGVLHDIGKMAVPVEILVKPGRLSDMEMSLIQIHPQAGYEILKGIEFPWPVALAALQHHERMDGSGYPQKLRGKEISLEARILAVADVVDAMTHHRPYRPAFSQRDAVEEIKKGRGRIYDKQVVDACLEVLEGREPFVISEYSTISTSPQLRRGSTNSSTLPTTTRMRSSGTR